MDSKRLFNLNVLKYRIFKSSMEITYSFFITIGLLFLSGYILSFCKISHPPLEELKKLFTPAWSVALAPKPKEHFIYISLLIVLPFFIFSTIFFVRNLLQEKIKIISFFSSLVILIIPVAISFPFLYHPDFINSLVSSFKTSTFFIMLLITILYTSPLLVSQLFKLGKMLPISNILFSYLIKNFIYLNRIISNKARIILTMFSILSVIIFQIIAYRVVNIDLVVDSAGAWSSHFQAVFYAVGQVVAGKTLLSDLPAQYGLYPELLRPIFLLIGLSVLKFTIILGILQLVASILLLLTISEYIKNKLLFFVCIVGLNVMASTTWLFLLGHWDPVYQIAPIRFFFPAISIFVFSFVAGKTDVISVSMFSLIAGIALLWNLDTGVPIYGAFLCYLLALFIFPSKNLTRLNVFKLISVASVIPLTVILLFISYLQLKAHSSLNLADALKYQNIFYVTGFAMLPIARGPSPWQVICAVYVLGLVIPLYGWLRGYRGQRWDTVFYLSIMGLGLFSYHEGRSHNTTLIFVSWPAFIVSFIISDYVLRLVKAKKLPYVFSVACFPVIFFGVLLTATFFNGIPNLYINTKNYWNTILYSPDSPTPIVQNVEFIKLMVKDDKEAIIFSPVQSVYYGETGLSSPLKGPGHIEILLQADYDNMVFQLMNYHHKHIFIQLDANLEIPTEYLFLLKKYKIIDRNQFMAYLTSIVPST